MKRLSMLRIRLNLIQSVKSFQKMSRKMSKKNVENTKILFVAAAERAKKAREEMCVVQPVPKVEHVNKLSLQKKGCSFKCSAKVNENEGNVELCSVPKHSVNMSISDEERPHPGFLAGAIFHGRSLSTSRIRTTNKPQFSLFQELK